MPKKSRLRLPLGDLIGFVKDILTPIEDCNTNSACKCGETAVHRPVVYGPTIMAGETRIWRFCRPKCKACGNSFVHDHAGDQ